MAKSTYTGPSKQDFLTQIDADLKTDEGESSEVLRERRKRVSDAKTDEAASKAYFGHLAELAEAAEETPAPTE
jgi:hypothetical protein